MLLKNNNQDKKTLELKFPNLPCLIDGEAKITKSIAVLKYIAKRFSRDDFLGKNPAGCAPIGTYLGIIKDLEVAYTPLFSNED
jgi:glutathione S-transferase